MPNRILVMCLILFMISVYGVSCKGCRDEWKKEKSEKSAETPAEKKDLERIRDAMNQGQFAESERMAKKLFDEAYASDPSSSKTWEFFLKFCESLAKSGDPDAESCYDRFIDQTKDLKMDDTAFATAYRWRTIMALNKRDKTAAMFFYAKLEPIEKKLFMQARLEPEIMAYSAYIHSGVLELQDDLNGAITELQRAIELYEKGNTKDPRPLQDYLDRLVDFSARGRNYQLSKNTLEKLIVTLEKTYGKVHPLIALAKLKLVNILLNIGDVAQARHEWLYVTSVFSGARAGGLPEDIDDLYTQTSIRFDILQGVSPDQGTPPSGPGGPNPANPGPTGPPDGQTGRPVPPPNKPIPEGQAPQGPPPDHRPLEGSPR